MMWAIKSLEVWSWRRKSFFGSFLLLLIIMLVPWTEGARVPGVERECNGIANTIKSKDFTYPWWTPSGSPVFGDEGISVGGTTSNSSCPLGRSGDRGIKCCKDLSAPIQRREMSTKFSNKWLSPKLQTNGEIFKERKKKFDVTFKDLLTRAHAAFHAMFERTYGMLYIQHASVFHALFSTLEAYYDTGRESLEGKLNEFFAILTKKMFVVLNSQYEFDDTYLSCATIVINEKQGGDLHRQIVSSLRRSFVATRALAQGLNDADRVFHNLQKLKIGPECTTSLSHMLQCPICSELRPFKPCTPYCTEITSSCLSVLVPLIKPWAEFTSAMENILDRLLGPYNVEAVVEPIHIKISEAIMNFQESGPDLSQAVFSKCGKARLKSAKNFRKREAAIAPPENLRRKPDDIPKGGNHEVFRATMAHPGTQPSKSLEKLLREIKNRIKKSKNMWDVLPRQVCNGISKDYSSQLCWNGTNAIKPDKNKTQEILDLRAAAAGKGTPNPLVSEQILIVQQISEKLRASYNGLDVQWIDENDDLDIDGSGMGSGSGDIPTDLEDSDDDDPDGEINPGRNQNRPVHPVPFNPGPQRPQQPKTPQSRPTPPPFLKIPLHEDDEEEDSEDDDNDSHNWNPFPERGGGKTGSSNKGDANNGFTIDGPDNTDFDSFEHLPPTFNKPPSPPVSKPIPPMFIPTEGTTTSTTTTLRTTTSTRKPPTDVIRRKYPSTTSGSIDEASRVLAFFKLFSPIFASMVGKAFSFT